MDNEKAVRVSLLAKMFMLFNQEASEERMRGYLDVTAPVPTAALDEAIKTALSTSEAGWPPGPGQIVVAWKENRSARPEERPYRAEAGPRQAAISTGQVLDQLAARVEPDGRTIIELAKELRRTHAKHFPAHGAESRTPSLVAAAMKLGVRWPMPPDHVAEVEAWMAKLGEPERAWWWTGKREAVTQWQGGYYFGPVEQNTQGERA